MSGRRDDRRGPRPGPQRPDTRGPRSDAPGRRDDTRGPRNDVRGPRGDGRDGRGRGDGVGFGRGDGVGFGRGDGVGFGRGDGDGDGARHRADGDGARHRADGDGGRHRAGGRGDGPAPVRGPGERVVYGANPVRELIARKPKTVRAIWVDAHRAGRGPNDPVASLIAVAREAGVRVEEREREDIDGAAGEGAVHQGVVAWLGPFVYAQLEELVTPGDEPPLIVALDGVEDPRNLGAILRSAYLLGARGVIIPEHRAAAVTAVTAKASAGASELLPIVQVGNLVRALEELREHGMWRVAVHAAEGAVPLAELDTTLPLVVVLGAEGTGVRPLVAKHCDFHAVIPMARDAVGSFNVSVAAAIALYEIRRQRSSAHGIPDEA